MKNYWFKRRGYQHFDAPVSARYAENVCNPQVVAQHSWLPLIHYVKREKRYKAPDGKTTYKERDIMFASHRDACILSKYAFDLNRALEAHYESSGLGHSVIAYRKLGRANYDFAADAYRFATGHSPCVVLCFDIKGFFDKLDHAILKRQLKRILKVNELPADWYAVFRHVTKFRKIELTALQAHPEFERRLSSPGRHPIGTISEIRQAGIPIIANPNKFGIPQGTPISSSLSNLYMMDVDATMVEACSKRGGLYQRYSDDILIICSPENEAAITGLFMSAIDQHKLEIRADKTERVLFASGSQDVFQYLGFNIAQDGAVIRPASLARQWRKAKRAIRTTYLIGHREMLMGRSSTIYTKNLRKRFAPVGARNFSRYARRAAKAFGSKKIIRQVLKFERKADQSIQELKSV